jgi:uroporphyrinogen-III synthase
MLPLKRVKVLVPRPIGQADEFSSKLEKLGAEPILFPLINIEAINKKEVKSTYQSTTFDWIIFTSSVAVQFFFNVVKPEEVTSKIAVVGTSTKKAVEELGLKVNFMPSAATAKKIVKEIPLNKGDKVFIPRSKIAGRAIIDTLKKRGIEVVELATYNNTPVDYTKEQIEEVLAQNINVITFTSPSTVENFVALLRKYKIKLGAQHIVSIGPSTTAAAIKMRLEVDKTAETHNVDGLIETIESMYK